VPLFKCTCEEKSVEIIATTPTQAANSLLKELGLQTNKQWSGPIFFGFLRKEIISKLSVNQVSDIAENETLNSEASNSDKVTINIAQRSGRFVNWLGIRSVGEDHPCDDGTSTTLWSYGSGENVVPLRPGYDARLAINSEGGTYEISCKIISSLSHNFGPIFQCAVISGEDNLYTTQEVKPTTAVRNVFNFLKIEDYKKKISGYEFFGFQRPDVIKQLQAKVCKPVANKCRKRSLNEDFPQSTPINGTIKKKFVSQYGLLDKVANTKTRNAGPTRYLKPTARKERNTLIHEMVKFTSFNDVQSYIVYLCQNDPNLVTSAIEESGSYLDVIVSELEITGPRHISLHNSAEFLIGKTRLSQREYIAASKTLKKANVYLSPYAAVAKYISELEVGVINLHMHCVDFEYEGLDCICSSAEFQDTLKRIMSTEALFQKFEFPTQEQQTKLFAHLKRETHNSMANWIHASVPYSLERQATILEVVHINLLNKCHLAF
jgi:hypothetical protein